MPFTKTSCAKFLRRDHAKRVPRRRERRVLKISVVFCQINP
jgi:hypothetical protein